MEYLEYRIEELEDENHWLEIKNMEVKRLERELEESRVDIERLEEEIEDLKEKHLPQNLRDEQLFEIFFENKDKFTVEEFEKLLND